MHLRPPGPPTTLTRRAAAPRRSPRALARCRGATAPPTPRSLRRGSSAAASLEITQRAESEGFEPPVPFPVHLISSQAPSTSSASSPPAYLADFPREAKRDSAWNPAGMRGDRYVRPCETIAFATLMNPAMLAPAT